METKKCLRCGGARLEPGAIRSSFQPTNALFWTLKTAEVQIEAFMCLDCGMIELVGDIKKAEALVRHTSAH